jgi:hypothetical protein
VSARIVYELCQMALADQRGVVAVLRAYLDESGIHDSSPVLTVGAYIARPRMWQTWTKRWNAAKRPIKVFHAADAANLRGEFKDWTHGQVAELVKKLLATIVDAELRGIVIGIHMVEFRKAMSGRADLLEAFPSPYAACFQWLAQIIMNLQADVSASERIAFIHETNDFRREALESFDWIKRYGNPQKSPIGLLFSDKATTVPLQAADILAYEGNKRMRDPTRPERRPWTALKPWLIAAHYGRENMGKLIDGIEKAKDGKIDEINLLGDGWNRAAGPWIGVARPLMVR